MVYLAALNTDNICVEVKQTKELIDDVSHVEIDDYDTDFIWRKYENGEWSVGKYYPEEQPIDPQQSLEEQMQQLQMDYNILLMSLTDIFTELQTLKGGE